MTLTNQDIETLQAEFPEGVPVWIANQSKDINEARENMNLRRHMQAKFAK